MLPLINHGYLFCFVAIASDRSLLFLLVKIYSMVDCNRECTKQMPTVCKDLAHYFPVLMSYSLSFLS